MFNENPDEVAVFDFDELADHLLEQGLEASPALLHGCLTGLLVAGAGAEPERGLDGVCEALDIVVHGELAGRLLQLYSVTDTALADEEFSFNLLVPDDDTDIETRTDALADWCRGFLAGFAQASVGADTAAADLSEEGSEIVRDIGAIAEASVGGEESEDESEASYMELVEYVRFATLNLFMEIRPDTAPKDTPSLH